MLSAPQSILATARSIAVFTDIKIKIKVNTRLGAVVGSKLLVTFPALSRTHSCPSKTGSLKRRTLQAGLIHVATRILLGNLCLNTVWVSAPHRESSKFPPVCELLPRKIGCPNVVSRWTRAQNYLSTTRTYEVRFLDNIYFLLIEEVDFKEKHKVDCC